MNVWFVNQYALPPNQPGGTRHFSLARALKKYGIKTTIIAANRSYFTGEKIADNLCEYYDEVEFHFLNTNPLSFFNHKTKRFSAMLCFAWSFQTFSRSVRSYPDIIIGSSPSLFSAWAACKQAKKIGIPFILELRDLWPQTLIDLGNYSSFNPGVLLLDAIERKLYRYADHSISLLPYSANHIKKKGGCKDRITWIPNFVDLDITEVRSTPPEELKYSEHGKYFTVIYAGAHGLANALDAILDAAGILQEKNGNRYRFLFIGDGHEKERLRQRAISEGIETVMFLPAVPKADITCYFAYADALIVNMNPSGLYQFGISFNKIYDYLAAGKPIVFGSDAANNPVRDSNSGICVPANDASAIALALEHLYNMPKAKRSEMGRRGRDYILAHHEVNILSQRLAVLLKEVNDNFKRSNGRR